MLKIGFYFLFFGVAVALKGHANEMPLYPTGPEKDSAFLRFINAGAHPLVVSSSRRETVLRLEKPYTAYAPVLAGAHVDGELAMQGSEKAKVSLQANPGEFITIIAMPKGGSLSTTLLRETPDDFNGLKASLAFVDISAGSCDRAELKVDGREVTLFQQVPVGAIQRRMINPVQLKVQLWCSDKPQGNPVDLGQLIAGERYSAIVVPSAGGARLLFVTDELAQ